jgi:hypothetical protein
VTREELTQVLQPIVIELRHGRIALEALVEAFAVPAPEPVRLVCDHPPEERLDFGITNGAPDWQCRLCGYRSLIATTA